MSKDRKALHEYRAPKYWPAWIGLGCLRLICLLPHRVGLGIGKAIGRLAHRLGATRRAIVRRNIELCFPELAIEERNQLARQHFEALGMSIIELGLGRWASDDKIMALTSIEGLDHLEGPLQDGQGVILLGAHFTTLEVTGRALRILGVPFAAVYRRNRSEFVTEFLRTGRERSAEVIIEKRDIKSMVRKLRNGGIVWYAPDQSYNRKGAEVVPFFGVPSMHTTATSVLARLGRATVVPLFQQRLPDGKYVVKLHPPLQDFPGSDPVEDVMKYMRVLEEAVGACPEQYFWIHRKFKDLPEGYEDYYADLDAAK
jgi:KDO2-lipid IV(A) lauroyltransferase